MNLRRSLGTPYGIATRQKCSTRQVNMTISLAFLAPDLVRAAVEGRLSRGIGVERLRDAPAEWSRQFEALGPNPQQLRIRRNGVFCPAVVRIPEPPTGYLPLENPPAGNGIFYCRDRRLKSDRETASVPRDRKAGTIPANIPAETACFQSTTVSAVREDWMVETIWTKLAAPHAVIETSLRNSSQERNFLLQRPGGETGSFGSIAGAETALTREFGRHVFEIAALLRVS
jgi:hypothetical protein